jgi:glycosyltransferase involved in cell wall biosynthesis
MPKVLRIINRLNLGGPTYNAAYLSRYLAPEFETMLVAGIKEKKEESSEFIVRKMGLNPVYIPEMRREINPVNDIIAYRKIREIIRNHKPDIVHTHAAKAGTIGRLAAINQKVPVILHTFHGHVFHSYFNPLKTGLFKSIERYLAKRSTRIIAISDLQKHELCNIHHICNPENTVVIPLGFELDRFRKNQSELRQKFRNMYQLEDDTVAIGIIGRIVPVKNHELFVRSIAGLKNKTSRKFRAFIIGDGDDKQKTEELAVSLGLTIGSSSGTTSHSDIVFTSWIIDIERALAGMDIIAMTSLNEGTPVSLIEAQAANKPVVSTDVGGIGNVVIPGQTALLSPSGDLNGFISNLTMLVESPEVRLDMAGKGWEFVKNRFHYNRLVEDTRTLYRSLLKEAGIS